MTLGFANLTAYCIQVTLVVGAGALLPLVFRLSAPRPRLLYWHALLLACLALPLVQPWRAQPVVVASDVTITTGPFQIGGQGASLRPMWNAADIALFALAAGVVLKLILLGAAFLRLHAYRRGAQRLLPLPDEARRVSSRLGVVADLYISTQVTSPVTFGFINPAILLPASFLELAEHGREAVLFHELLHVRRNDWMYAIAEEIVRCLLWFHPAVWWLLGRIQLTREQVVDETVIEHTQQRDQYLEALISIAATRLRSDLAPAPLFLKKRHLRQRVASIVKGARMSKHSLLLSSLAVFSALPLVVGIAAWQFPLSAAAQEVRDAEGVTVVPGYYKTLHRTPIAFPDAAREKGLSGAVVVSVSVNSKGEVTDAKVVSGTEEFRRAVLESVLSWHFATEPWQVESGARKPVPAAFEIAVKFEAPPNRRVAKAMISAFPTPHPSMPIDKIDLSGLPQALQERVASANLVREGEIMTPERLQQVNENLRQIDDHLRAAGATKNDSIAMRVFLQQENQLRGTLSASAALPGEQTPPPRVRIGGNVAAANLVEKVTPLYPPEAKMARIQGTVQLNVNIGKDGHVIGIQAESGHPLLIPASVEAVRQWVYKPVLLNGEPVEVTTKVDVNFTLSQ